MLEKQREGEIWRIVYVNQQIHRAVLAFRWSKEFMQQESVYIKHCHLH